MQIDSASTRVCRRTGYAKIKMQKGCPARVSPFSFGERRDNYKPTPSRSMTAFSRTVFSAAKVTPPTSKESFRNPDNPNA